MILLNRILGKVMRRTFISDFARSSSSLLLSPICHEFISVFFLFIYCFRIHCCFSAPRSPCLFHNLDVSIRFPSPFYSRRRKMRARRKAKIVTRMRSTQYEKRLYSFAKSLLPITRIDAFLHVRFIVF